MACYIFGAGSFYGLTARPRAGDFTIAADGGWLACRKTEVIPDLLLGDFDSMEQPADFANVLRSPVEKDDTDMMAAIRLGRERGFRSFCLYGGTGGRVDHTLANLQSLVWLSRRGCQGALIGDGWTARAVTNGMWSFGPEHRGLLSVFCMGDRAEGVWLRGLKYPLEGAALTCDFPLGVSNEFTGAAGSVSVERGTLLVVYYWK